MRKQSKIGVVDVGGGLRGIYAAGIFDYCMEHSITFDYAIGVSAGGANLASFAARQPGRNYRFYTTYSRRKEYMSLKNFVFKRSYIDMQYVYGTLSRKSGEDPLDYETLKNNPMELEIVATNADTGKPIYFSKSDIHQDRYDVFMASSSIPFVCRPQMINGIPCYDGALGDPIPFNRAFKAGCDKVVVILTKPVNTVRDPLKDMRIADLIRHKYPYAAWRLNRRAKTYNDSVEEAKKLQAQGKVLIIAPESTCGLTTLTQDVEKLDRLYHLGYKDAERLNTFCR